MDVVVAMAVNFGLPLGLILFAFVSGKLIERRHFKRIAAGEAATAHQPAITAPNWDLSHEVEKAELVQGAVVVSIDYFKRFMAGLYNLVGGRVRSFESILDRGRREAVLRMKAACPDADIFVNLRLETSMLASTTSKGQYLGGVEVIAYATAIRYRRQGTDEIHAEIAR